MSDVSDPELYSVITNVCKPPKSFVFPVTVQYFRSVGRVSMGLLFSVGGCSLLPALRFL